MSLPGWNPVNKIKCVIPPQGEELINFPVLINLSENSGVTDFDCSAVFDEFKIDDETVLLIHSDTTDGSTDFIDSSSSGHPITAYGDINHSTDYAKFSDTSIHRSAGTSRLELGNHAGLHFEAENFTVDFFFKCATASPTITLFYCSCGQHELSISLTSTGFTLYVSSNGTSWSPHDITTTVTTNIQYHLALVRDGANFTLYIDGVSIDVYVWDNTIYNEGGIFSIAGHNSSSQDTVLYIDEFRISKGIARWTDNFTPPKAAYGDHKCIAFEIGDTGEQCYCEIENWEQGDFGSKTDVNATRNLGSSDNGSAGLSSYGSPIDNATYYTFDGNDGLYSGSDLGDSSTEVVWARVRIHNKDKGTAQIIWKDGGDNSGVAVGIDASGNLGIFGVNAGTPGTPITIPIADYENGVWYDIFFTRTRVSVVNKNTGCLVATAIGSCSTGDGSDTESLGYAGANSPLTQTNANNIEFFEGDIDSVEIYTEGELQAPSISLAQFWVKIPTISATEDTIINLYYDSDHIYNDILLFASIDDDFIGANDVPLNSELWMLDAGSATIQNNAAQLSDGALVNSTYFIDGDFDIQVAWDKSTGSWGSGSTLRLLVTDIDGNYFMLYREETGERITATDGNNYYVNTANWDSGFFKIILSGTSVGLWYKRYSGDSWIEAHTFTTVVSNYFVTMRTTGSTTALFDDFVATSSTPPYKYLYVGDTGEVPAQNVWDDNFAAVYHMSQDPSGGADCILDSTANANHGTPNGSMTSDDLVPASIGYGLEFDGSNDYINLDTVLDGFAISKFSAELSFSTTQAGSDHGVILFSIHDSDDTSRLRVANDTKIRVHDLESSSSFISTTTITDGQVHTLSVTGDNSTSRLFLNGTQENTATHNISFSSGGKVSIAQEYDPTNVTGDFFNGMIDEVRISSVDRTSIWIATTNKSNRDNLIMFSFSSNEGITDKFIPSFTNFAKSYNISFMPGIKPAGLIRQKRKGFSKAF